MVLPTPAADDDAPEVAAALGKLARALSRVPGAALMLLREASPSWLGLVVRHLAPPPDLGPLRVCLRGPELAALPAGSRVLLRLRGEDLDWLNVCRPLIVERQLRLVLWADGATAERLQRDAVDLASWISHVFELPPPRLPGFALAGVRAALAAGVEWSWQGPGLAEALRAAGVAERLDVSAGRRHRELVAALARPGLVVVSGVRGIHDLTRVRLALAHAGRPPTWVADQPPAPLPGLIALSAEQQDWDEAARLLAAASRPDPALRAALLELEAPRVAAEADDSAREWSAEDLAGARAPAFAWRERATDPDVLAARQTLRSADAHASWFAELAALGDGTPARPLIDALARAGLLEPAAALAAIRWERGADARAEDLTTWLEQLGYTGEAASIADTWSQRARTADDERGLAAAFSKLGDLHVALGNADQARRFFEDSLVIRRRLVDAEPGRADLQRDLSVSYNQLGDLHIALGNADQARRFFEDSLVIRRRLVDAEPGRADLLRDLSISYERLGDLHRALGNADQARRFFEDSLALAKRLVDAEPGRADLQRDLAISYERMATVDPDRALPWLSAAVAIRRQRLAAEPANAVVRRELAITLLQLARHIEQDEVVRVLRESYDLLQDLYRRGALEASYHRLVDQLRQVLSG